MQSNKTRNGVAWLVYLRSEMVMCVFAAEAIISIDIQQLVV